jgi:putative membrane protein
MLTTVLTTHGWHGHWFWPLIPLAWFTVFALFAVLFWRRGCGPRRRDGVDRARGILAERYARGELDHQEYRERLDGLA